MPSKLDKLKQRVLGSSETPTVSTEFYLLAKELGCLPELLGREFEVEYNEEGKISRIIQKPMKIPTFVTLMNEMEKDYRRQEREMKKSQRKGRRR